jgi:hypothetical protein
MLDSATQRCSIYGVRSLEKALPANLEINFNVITTMEQEEAEEAEDNMLEKGGLRRVVRFRTYHPMSKQQSIGFFTAMSSLCLLCSLL